MTNAFIKAILISQAFHWSISNLLFKVAMCTGKKSHTALQWSEQGYNIEFRWEQGVNKQTEHLNIELVNGDIRLEPYRVCRRVNILRDYPDDKTKLYPRN